MTRALLNDAEQGVMDHITAAMEGIQRDLGCDVNGGELASAVHVLQGFVIQHMLHRLEPEVWSGWSAKEGENGTST